MVNPLGGSGVRQLAEELLHVGYITIEGLNFQIFEQKRGNTTCRSSSNFL